MIEQKNEFNIYMHLGSCLEQENKLLMAYGAYMEAMKKAETEHRKVISDYLFVLAGKLSKIAQERNEELKNQLLQWIKEGNIAFALACFYNICEELEAKKWFDTEVAILYQSLNIYKAECNQGIIPWKIAGKDMKEIRKWYYRLKFLVRRIDMGLSNEEEFVAYIKREKISTIGLYEIINQACLFHQKVYGYLVGTFKKHGLKDYEVFFENLWDGRSEYNECSMKLTEREITGKIAFIIAVSEEDIYQEAVYYIQQLKVPQNMEIEIVPVRGATSITSAYNKGMQMTDAEYKVYLHQDAMVVNPYMIYEICDIFQNQEIGMIGVAGASYVPENGIWWGADKDDIYINIYQDTIIEYNRSYQYEYIEKYKEVKVIDGVMMITRYDIPWREDLFKNWHFYDVSQSMEFNKKNYKIVVPRQEKVWCLHEQKWNKEFAKDYFVAKEVFLEEYKEFLGK